MTEQEQIDELRAQLQALERRFVEHSTDPRELLLPKSVTGEVIGDRAIAADENVRFKMIRGIVTTTAAPSITINEGAGFTATRISAGRVHIDFTVDFVDTPAVIAIGDAGCTFMVNANTDATGCRFANMTDAGVAAEGTIHFIAIGPTT